ncbi:MAG: glycosyltransferase [Verrucomicrobiota bacterium]|nr:glycosyltransferase [Verrucomicrobiota bacterium]
MMTDVNTATHAPGTSEPLPAVPQDCSVAILCHSDKRNGKRDTGSGPIEPLLAFFRANKARYIFIVEQPHPMKDVPLDCTMEVWRDGERVAEHVSTRYRPLYDIPSERRQGRTYIRLKLRDCLASSELLSLIPTLYPDCGALDLFIGMESLNVLVGQRFRRRLGIRSLVYYTFDWAPRRYASRLLSAVFRWLDKRACQCADVAWNVTDTIAEARRTLLRYDLSRMARQLTVNYGVEYRERLVKPYEELEKFKVIFSGPHHIDNGAQFLPEIARRVQAADPRIRFVVTGLGALTPELKARVAAYELTNIEFLGFVKDAETLDRLACECVIALAPYPDTPSSTKKYGDVIKIRLAFACGLAVVSTHVPPASREIRDEGLGLVTDVSADAMADAVLRLCADESLLKACRERAIQKARRHNWHTILTHAVAASLAQPPSSSDSRQ